MGPIETNANSTTDHLAKMMFVLSLVFLALVASLIVLWVDMPRVELLAGEVGEGTVSASETSFLERNATEIGEYFFIALLSIWPLFWLELLYNFGTRTESAREFLATRKSEIFACLCPPLRLAAPNHQMDKMIWLPHLGWKHSGKPLMRKLEHLFGTPMLIIALFILPILLVEFGLKSVVESNFGLQLTLHICTGLIWCAFAIEFIVMINATDKKLAYVKKNWIDLAIILLPLISFLRSLRAIRAFKVAKFAKVQQLARVGRIYRMRGLMAKALRALMLLEFLNRLLRITPEKKLSKLLAEKEELMEELDELEQKILATRNSVEAEKQRRAAASAQVIQEQNLATDPATESDSSIGPIESTTVSSEFDPDSEPTSQTPSERSASPDGSLETTGRGPDTSAA